MVELKMSTPEQIFSQFLQLHDVRKKNRIEMFLALTEFTNDLIYECSNERTCF